MEDVLRRAIAEAASEFELSFDEIEISYPDAAYGDFATNTAMKLAKKAGKNPRDIAVQLIDSLRSLLGESMAAIDIAGPGFINFRLSDKTLIAEMTRQPAQPLKGQVVVTEFSDPNPFKILHAGHLYTSIVGDVISRLLSASGAEVHRVSYGGDVGRHVGITMWSMLRNLEGANPDKLADIPIDQRSDWMSQAYVSGTQAFEADEQARQEIMDLNRKVYEIHSANDHQSDLAKIYWTTREWSYAAFDKFYSQLNIVFDKYYPESETAPIGLKTVNEQLTKGVFERSDGAIVFRGEPFGLHTRVFINSQGLPTYEAKELGLVQLKKSDFNYDQSVIITGSEQEQYMAVVYKALEQFAPELAANTTHMPHGMVRLTGGKKMSSRAGNILRAEDVLQAAAEASEEVSGKKDKRVVLAAIKYSMLKQRLGGDIIYDPKESVSILGNSGPYLQYSHARARSIMTKSQSGAELEANHSLNEGERSLVLMLSRYASVVGEAAASLSPHLLCNYLYEMAQTFNRFYEANRVIGDANEAFRIGLVGRYAERLKDGLELMGIEAPERL